MLKHLLKYFNLIKNKAALAFTISALLITLCCGKRKPPLPPIEKMQQRAEISAVQRGNKIFLSMELPNNNASDSNANKISRADVYRLIEPLNSSLTLTEEEFTSRSNIIASISLSESDFNKKTKTFIDSLEFAGQPARIRYAVRFVNPAGQKATFSNFLLIEPTSKIANQPLNLTAVQTEDSVNLKWEAPVQNVDDSKPANILGYNIYRTNEGVEDAVLLNDSPVTKESFSDETFKFGTAYQYFARTVSIGNNAEPLESLSSNVVLIRPLDIFPPAAPTALTIAAAPGNLSVFFAFNDEKDVAGYRIYRSENASEPKSRWKLLNSELLKTNTFQDATVASGITYYYFVTAVDLAGNESQPSEVVSEKTP